MKDDLSEFSFVRTDTEKNKKEGDKDGVDHLVCTKEDKGGGATHVTVTDHTTGLTVKEQKEYHPAFSYMDFVKSVEYVLSYITFVQYVRHAVGLFSFF